MFQYIMIVAFAAIGFFLALHIWKKKQPGENLVCPAKAHCTEVVHSDFSSFFGVGVEKWGMAYYAFIVFGYALLLLFETSLAPLGYVLLPMTFFAFLFSVYLTFIQMFALRKFCTWCLMSASLCTVIFAISLQGSFAMVVPFLARYTFALTVVERVALAVGLGVVTVGSVFFVNFLKDFRISVFEAAIMNVISQLSWAAIAVVVVAGFGRALPALQGITSSPLLLEKSIVLLVIIAVSAGWNLIVAPQLIRISFRQDHKHVPGELDRERAAMFMLSAVSLTSWIVLFLLEIMGAISLTTNQTIGVYTLVVIASLVAGKALNEYYCTRCHTV